MNLSSASSLSTEGAGAAKSQSRKPPAARSKNDGSVRSRSFSWTGSSRFISSGPAKTTGYCTASIARLRIAPGMQTRGSSFRRVRDITSVLS